MEERLQKFLSEQGVASRRKAETFIAGGHVTVNGKAAKLGDKVNPDKDIIKVFGKIIKPTETKLYIALNKPKGYMVTKHDPYGRKTIFSLLPEELRTKVWNVGRLDYDTEGLLILTNDGDLTQRLAHPKYEHDKEYEVTTTNTPTKEQMQDMEAGVKISTGFTHPAKVTAKNNKVRIIIHEGKKHQIRRMFDSVGLDVQKLKRIRVNKLQLPNIPAGSFSQVTKEDIL